LDAARTLAACVFELALRQGDRFGLAVIGGKGLQLVPAGSGPRQRDRCLLALAGLSAEGGWPDEAGLRPLWERIAAGHLVLLLSDDFDEAAATLMEKLSAARREVLNIQLLTSEERDFPFRGGHRRCLPAPLGRGPPGPACAPGRRRRAPRRTRAGPAAGRAAAYPVRRPAGGARMIAGFATPLALWALAALALPLLLHLARRERQQRTVFAALAWLLPRQRPRRRLRLQEWLLLILRMGLLAVLALLLAQPLRAPEAPLAWELVHPALPAPEGEVPEGVQRRWLAPGFPPTSTPAPSAEALPLASLLREADAALPAQTKLTVRLPRLLTGLDAQALQL